MGRVQQAYARGPDGLFATSRRLFTSKTLQERLSQSNQQLSAWLLRVENAQSRVQLDPTRVRQDQEARAAKEAHDRAAERQRRRFRSWAGMSTSYYTYAIVPVDQRLTT